MTATVSNKRERFNLVDLLVLMSFVNQTDDKIIEAEDVNEGTNEVRRALTQMKESPAVKALFAVAEGAGYTEGGELTKHGIGRAIQMFNSNRKERLNFEKLAQKLSISEMLALIEAVVPELERRIDSKEEFKPSDRVKELLETNAERLYRISGWETEVDDVAAE